jgi:L-threonylcarbamoyladenylate synthase
MTKIDRIRATIEQVAACLTGGGVALVPTDTVYGLAVHPEYPAAKERLFAMKRRPGSVNLPIMVASWADVPALGVEITAAARRLAEVFFPGPLTLALGVRDADSPNWLAGRVECAVRIPDDDYMLNLLRLTGPLLVTSANIHDQATPESVAAILASFDTAPDVVLDGGIRKVVPSTLVNCNLPEPVIEREGLISRRDIEQVLS